MQKYKLINTESNKEHLFEKEFVPYVESLALKELGFDEPCLRVGNPNGHIMWKWLEVDDNIESVGIDDILKTSFDKRFINIPTYSQAFRWFRDKYDLSGFVLPFAEKLFDYRIYSTQKGEHLWSSIEYKSHEQAELACLQKLIEVCKKK